MTFQERLRVPWLWWLIALGLIASLALAVFAYVDLWIAVTLVVVASLALVTGLLSYTLRICVADGTLTVGRNTLQGRYIADAVVDELQLRGPDDERCHLVLRPYVQQKVRIILDDPADPHPAWIVSTRRPDELAAAVRAIKEP